MSNLVANNIRIFFKILQNLNPRCLMSCIFYLCFIVYDVIPWLNHATIPLTYINFSYFQFGNGKPKMLLIEITSMMQWLLLNQIVSSCPKCLRIDLDVFTSSKFFLWGKVHNIMTPIIHNQLWLILMFKFEILF